jgi:hypothetical protein
MSTNRTFVSTLVASIATIAVGSAALAQLSAADRKCSDKINNDARKVVAAEGKGNRKTCVDGGSGDISACVTAVQSASAASKLSADFTAKCGTLPAFGVNASSSAINTAAQGAADNIVNDVFGDPAGGIVPGDKCQDKMAQRPYQLAVAEWKAFRGCAKGLGAINTIADLEGCIASGIAAGESAKGGKVGADAGTKCTTFPPGAELGGACTSSADATTLATCITQHVDCEVCKGLYTSIGDDANNVACNAISGLPSCVIPPCVPPPPGSCPVVPGRYATTQVNSPSFCTGGANAGLACNSDADCPGPQLGFVPFCGGNLKVYTFAPFPFPAGGTIVQDVGSGDANCVHNTVVPMPGGFSAPNFCVPALGYTVSVTQTGCGVGRIDSNGGSDFTVEEVGDTSDTTNANCTGAGTPKACCTGAGTGTCTGVCGLTQTGGACGFGADGSGRVDITVGDGVTDTCVGSGVANALVEVPVHTVTWQDNSAGTFGACPGDGTFNTGDTIITQFNQILDFSTDTAHAHWADLDGDGCSLAGAGPAAGEAAIKGRCMDTAAAPVTIATASAGNFFSSGTPFDGSFSTFLTSTVTQTGPFQCSTCSSPPAINFAGTATRCLP